MKPLFKFTEKIVEKNISRLGAIQSHIFLNWKDIAGQYSEVTFPKKIILNKNKKPEGSIIIKVQNGFGPEIQLAVPFLLNQINAKYGFNAITKIKIVQTELGYLSLENDLPSKHIFVSQNNNLISKILPEGEIKLAMEQFELSRIRNK